MRLPSIAESQFECGRYERLAAGVGCLSLRGRRNDTWLRSTAQRERVGGPRTAGFACTGVRKQFVFISSVAACYSTHTGAPIDEGGGVAELGGIHLGYAQSKWAAERLVEACRARGLSAQLYRPSLLLGDSVSGRGNDDDLIAQLIRGVI
jgi:thioester reductase-like protein